MMRAIPLLLAALLLPIACAPADDAEDAPAGAGEPTEASAAPAAEEGWPAGWDARLDHPDRGTRADVEFETMSPGWHVTTGPAAILYDSTRTAQAPYRLETEMHLFDPGERREGFGVFIGGRDLQGEGQAYTYFLLRRDGRFLIKRRDGERTSTVTDWTEAPAVNTWEERAEGGESVSNTMAVDVGAQEVVFSVNGTEVARVPADQVDADGIAGLRINHSLNVHVARFEIRNGGGQ